MTMTTLPPQTTAGTSPDQVVPAVHTRRRTPRETPEVADGARRLIRAVARRAETDLDALPLLAQLGADVDEAMARAVKGCRDFGWSWADVGRVLGVTRQAAQKRYGHLEEDTAP